MFLLQTQRPGELYFYCRDVHALVANVHFRNCFIILSSLLSLIVVAAAAASAATTTNAPDIALKQHHQNPTHLVVRQQQQQQQQQQHRSARRALPLPRWGGPEPNASLPLGGFPQLPKIPSGDVVAHLSIFKATAATGTYNHGAMIERHGGFFHAMWKNSPFDEDSDGQRMLYASSRDGRVWSRSIEVLPGLPAHLFNASLRKVHLQPAPFVRLNGRLYASSTTRGTRSSGDSTVTTMALG
eukprot:UC1_evm1s617